MHRVLLHIVAGYNYDGQMEQMKNGSGSTIDLKYDRQDVIETRKFQIQFDKHLFSVRKTAAVERQHSFSTDARLQQKNSTEHDSNNILY